MKTSLLLFVAAAGVFAQSFPSSVYVPYVAKDNVSTTLSTAMGASDNVAIVVSSAGWAANMLAYICDSSASATKCTSSFEIMLVTNVNGNILSVTRAQGGTSAVAHASGRIVANSPVALYTTSVNNEVQAIENALGPNLTNVSSSVSSSRYNFAAISPGGSLTGGGGAQTITIRCPLGIVVSGTFATALYISGGTGTAEWLRPSGGTCTSGATSGTIIISPANNHSGAWTVTSATAGIDLACASAPSLGTSAASGAYVTIPPGDYDIFGTIRPSKGCTIDGLGTPSANGPSGAVTLHMQTNSIPMFDIAAFAVTIKNIQLSFGSYPAYTVAGSPAASGSVGIQYGVTNSGDTSGNSPYIENLIINNFYNDMVAKLGVIRVQNMMALAAVQDCVVTGGNSPGLGGGYMDSVLAQGCGGNGFTMNLQAALQWSRVAGFNNHGWCIAVTSAAFQIDDIDCEADLAGEISITTPQSGSWLMQDVIAQACGQTFSWGTNTSAPCIKVQSGGALGVLSNINISGAEGNGLQIDGDETTVIGANINTTGIGAVSGNIYCLEVAGSLNNISGVTCNDGVARIGGIDNKVSGNYFNSASASTAVVSITSASNVQFCGNTIISGGAANALAYSSSSGSKCDNYIIVGGVTGALTANATTYSTVTGVPLANLGACSAAKEGTTGAVSDSSVTTWGSNVANGGANHVLAFCNGTNWTVAGK